MRDTIHIFIFILTTLLVGVHSDIAYVSHDTSLIDLVSLEYEAETEVEAEFEYMSMGMKNLSDLILDDEFYFAKDLIEVEIADNNTPPPE